MAIIIKEEYKVGKFLDTTYVGTINSILDSQKSRLDNTFYTFTDKTPTTVTYYNIDTSNTTLDEGSILAYSYTDGDSPIRYNKIKDALLFGMERIQVQMESGDFGIEADSIEGEAYIPPNAFKPYPQDYFIINHTDEEYLFKVTNVSLDTLPTGANMYKIAYKLSSHDSDNTDIDDLVVDNFVMDTTNIGTNLSLILKSDDYNYTTRLENICLNLKTYYRSLFYSNKVQTFIYTYDNRNFYDGFMIEFIRRGNLMNSSELDYLQVAHQIYPKSTFALDYMQTMFNAIERKDKNTINNPSLYGMLVQDKTSLLYYNIEEYYEIFTVYRAGAYNPISAFDDDTVIRIRDNERYDTMDPFYFKNIIIDYFNDNKKEDGRLDDLLIDSIEEFNYTVEAATIFYYVPVIIYILERHIRELLKNPTR